MGQENRSEVNMFRPHQLLIEELRHHTLLLNKIVGLLAESHNPTEDGFISVKIAAELLNRDPSTIRRWISENCIHGTQVTDGGAYLIPKSEIARLQRKF